MAAADYVTEVLSDSPMAFYEMQEASGNPQDSSGNGWHITTSGGSPDYRQIGPMSGSYSIRLPFLAYFSRATFSTAVDNITVECWLQAVNVAAGVARGIWNNYGVNDARNAAINGWGFFIADNAKLQSLRQGIDYNAQSSAALSLPAYGSNLLPILGVGGGNPTTASWTHIVVTRDAGTWKYYVNGSVDTSNAGTGAPAAAASSGGYTARMDISQPNETADVRIAYVAYYETALSSTQVSDHYNAA